MDPLRITQQKADPVVSARSFALYEKAIFLISNKFEVMYGYMGSHPLRGSVGVPSEPINQIDFNLL